MAGRERIAEIAAEYVSQLRASTGYEGRHYPPGRGPTAELSECGGVVHLRETPDGPVVASLGIDMWRAIREGRGE